MLTKDVTSFEAFIGIVEDIDDPLQLGRCRVRVFQHHDANIATEDLDWAMPLGQGQSLEGVGISPTWYAVGTTVVGFYLDGKTRHQPLIWGALNKIPGNDTERHSVAKPARGEDTFEQNIIGPEPEKSYGAQYPHNKSITTSSGHVVEVDDTPNNSRIHIRHSSGTYVEINNTGRITIKSEDDRFDIIDGKHTTYVNDDSDTEIKGDEDRQTDGDRTVKINGKDKLKVGSTINIDADGKITIKSGGVIRLSGTKVLLN